MFFLDFLRFLLNWDGVYSAYNHNGLVGLVALGLTTTYIFALFSVYFHPDTGSKKRKPIALAILILIVLWWRIFDSPFAATLILMGTLWGITLAFVGLVILLLLDLITGGPDEESET